MSSSVHAAISLDYSFPQPYHPSTINFHGHIPSDIILSKNLKISDDPKPTQPKYSKVPISTKFITNGPIEDPLDEILKQSRRIIENYKLEFPTQSKTNTIATPKKSPTGSHTSTRSKRKRQTSYENNSELIKQDIENNAPTSNLNTPVPNKTIFFSPTGSAKRELKQSTPVSVRKEASLNHQKSARKLLKLDKASAHKDWKSEESHPEDSYDELACHADNILRMAIDSTMLGSTFDGSFSINNTFANYSVLDDRDDHDKSVIELLQARSDRKVNKPQPIKIEINADDIDAAVNGI